jgi:hypothetical protein
MGYFFTNRGLIGLFSQVDPSREQRVRHTTVVFVFNSKDMDVRTGSNNCISVYVRGYIQHMVATAKR